MRKHEGEVQTWIWKKKKKMVMNKRSLRGNTLGRTMEREREKG